MWIRRKFSILLCVGSVHLIGAKWKIKPGSHATPKRGTLQQQQNDQLRRKRRLRFTNLDLGVDNKGEVTRGRLKLALACLRLRADDGDEMRGEMSAQQSLVGGDGEKHRKQLRVEPRLQHLWYIDSKL